MFYEILCFFRKIIEKCVFLHQAARTCAICYTHVSSRFRKMEESIGNDDNIPYSVRKITICNACYMKFAYDKKIKVFLHIFWWVSDINLRVTRVLFDNTIKQLILIIIFTSIHSNSFLSTYFFRFFVIFVTNWSLISQIHVQFNIISIPVMMK